MSARGGGISGVVTAAVVGAVVALIVLEVSAFGIDVQRWTLHVPRALDSAKIGAIAGAASNLFGNWRSGR